MSADTANQAVFIEVSGDEWLESIIRDESLDKEIKLTARKYYHENSRIRNCWTGRSNLSLPR